MIQYFPTITGSLTVNGDLIVTGTGSMSASLALNSNLLQGTGSTGFATTASLTAVSSSQQQISASLLTLTASYAALSSSYTALSGSYNTFSGSASTRITANSSSIQQVSSSQQQISASLLNVVANYATTGSNSFRANQSITGSLVVSSTITAQTLVVQTVTSSILYSSGSNIFGNQLANTQTFTGSVNITGSLNVVTTGTEFQVNNTGVVMGNLLTDAHRITGSLSITGSTHSIFGNVGIGTADLGPDGLSLSTNFNYAWSEGSGNAYATLFRQRNSAATVMASGYKRSNTGAFASSYGISMARAAIAIGSNNGSIAFFSDPSSNVANGTDITPSERMTILNSGYVGIGTTNPTGSLDVSGSIYIRSTGGGVLYIPRMADQSRGLSIGEQTALGSKSAVIRTAGGVSEHLFIDPGFNNSDVAGNIALAYANTGSVGIGTYLPSTKLHVVGLTGGASGGATSIPSLGFANSSSIALFTNKDTAYGTLFGTLNTGVGWIQQQRVDGTGTAYNLLLQPNGGNVGIGTNSTTDQLTVAGSGAILRLKSSLSYTDMAFQNSVVTNFIESEEGRFHFFVGGGSAGNRQLTVSSSGMVGIGTAVPAYNLDVVGSGRFTGNVYASGVPLQVVAGNADVTSGAEGTGHSLVSNASGITPAWNDGLQVASISFTPKKSNSIILIQTNNIVMWEKSNVSDQFYLWASNYTDGIVLVKSGQRLMNFGPGYQNGGIISLCGYFSSWGTSAKTISFRIGTTGGAAGAYFEWNPYYGSSGFSSATVGNFTYVITEIGQ